VLFEALVADNLEVGRPDEGSLIFDRRIHSDTDSGFATRVITRGVKATVNVCYKHSAASNTAKGGRALRIETVINPPTDFGVNRRLGHLDELQARPVQPTAACWTLNGPVGAASLPAQPLRGSRSHPPMARRDSQPERCASAIPGSWPWPVPYPAAQPVVGFTVFTVLGEPSCG
jgi:hypothetical protein